MSFHKSFHKSFQENVLENLLFHQEQEAVAHNKKWDRVTFWGFILAWAVFSAVVIGCDLAGGVL
jgi:hypothetical protein